MTLRQKALAKNLGNSRTLKEALLKSGYAPTTAHQQTSIIESKTFEQLIEQELKNEEVINTHKEGLQATRIHGTNDNFIEIPDYGIRLKAAELAYKVKGKLKDGLNVAGDINMNVVVIRHADN